MQGSMGWRGDGRSGVQGTWRFAGRGLGCFLALALMLGGRAFAGLKTDGDAAQPAFPETNALMPQVARHQKDIEAQFNLYTFTDTTTVSTLDKAGKARKQHTDVYYVTPTPYEIFVLHISHDGKAASEADLEKQQNTIEKKLRADEHEAEKQGELHPKDTLMFADIVKKSRFTPLRWEEMKGKRVVVYAFEAAATPESHGDLMSRVAGDMKGKMWISPDDEEILRVEFSSAAPLSLGMGVLGNVKSFDGYVEQRKVHDEVWLPTHEEFVASGRQLVSGFRIRQVSDYSDYLKATTDVFQQMHAGKGSASQSPASQSPASQNAPQNGATSQPEGGGHD